MADLVNPFANWRVSQGWTQGSHAKNPAIDYPMPVGTRLYAPAAGKIRLQHWNGSRSGGNPGNKVVIDLPNGRSIHMAHLSSFAVSAGQNVAQNQFLGLSGNTGDVRPAPTRANPNSGAHLHTFGLNRDGSRWNWVLDAASPSGGGGGSTPFIPKGLLMALTDREQEEVLSLVRDIQNRVRGPLDQPYDMLQGISGATNDIQQRIRGPLDRPYDMLQSIEGVTSATLTAVNNLKLGNVDVKALAAAIKEDLGAEIAGELAKRLAE